MFIEAQKLRVRSLLRVSDKSQLENQDIPQQREACREFIESHPNWELTGEYTEKGKSGYKLPAKQRDVLQQVLRDAKAGAFDILVVFMSDRVGRRLEESPHIIETLAAMGVQTWTVAEGHLKCETQTDRLINTIRFLQAEGESIKTSIRVTDDQKRMVQDGHYRGGAAPYGYEHVMNKELRTNKDGRILKDLVVKQGEAAIVRQMFDKVTAEGWGGNRIAKWLNSNHVPSRSGTTWSMGTVNYILRNPIYKGCYTFGKRTRKTGVQNNQAEDLWILSPVQPRLQLVSDEQWAKAQRIRKSRNPQTQKRDSTALPTRGKMLLSGLAYCGHCGSPLNVTYFSHNKQTSRGEVRRKSAKYRCIGKALNRVECPGQTVYAAERINAHVLEIIFDRVQKLKEVDLDRAYSDFIKFRVAQKQEQSKRIQAKMTQAYKELRVLTREIAKTLLGESSFTPEILRQLIDEKNAQITNLNEDVTKASEDEEEHRALSVQIRELKDKRDIFRTEFENATLDEQKMMVSELVERVTVFRDKVVTRFRPWIDDILAHYSREASSEGEGMRNRKTSARA